MGVNLYFMSGNQAVEMSEHQYDSESDLQKIIADNPNLLLRDTDPDDACLMLIGREFKVAENDDSSNAFYLDHLLVDQDGILVLVEVKQSTNTQIRREVVGQMFDYASRVATWDVGELRERFRESNAGSDLLDEYDTDEFWTQVATCLKAERFRLVFAADRIPSTLKTMIEFLDRRMTDIEVYGVELRQYKTDGALLLSSNVIGNPLLKQQKAASSGRRVFRSWTLDKCLDNLKERGLESITQTVEDIWNFAVNDLSLVCKFRNGKRPAFRGYLGDWVLFEVSAWWRKKSHICTIDFFLPNHVQHLTGTEWDEARLRTLFMDLPGKDTAIKQGLMWESPKCVYIDLHLMADTEFSAAFRQMLKKICDLTAAAQNSHYD